MNQMTKPLPLAGTPQTSVRHGAHTPGPWATVTKGRDLGCLPGRQLYARVGRAGAGECMLIKQTDGMDAEYEANLAVILAAPDLLTALIDLLPHAQNSFSHHGIEQRRAALTLAHAAIAKAKL